MIERRLLSPVLPVVALLSCSTPPAPPAPNLPPVAEAGQDQFVGVGETVLLDARASSDHENEPLSYRWRAAIGNPAPVITNEAVSFSFTPAVEGIYTFYLEVFDSGSSSEDSVQIQVSGSSNRAPVADLGPQRIDSANPIVLDGTPSSDPDGDLLAYMWEALEPPAPLEIVDPAASVTSFVASVSGAYVIRLTVSDGQLQHVSEITILVQLSDNILPIADAGSDLSAQVGQAVILDGSSSSDPDGNLAALYFHWSVARTPGPAIVLIDSTTAYPSFIPTTEGDYIFGLVVTDDEGSSIQDIITVRVTQQTFVEAGGMIEIPSGPFTMGTNLGGQADETPPHLVDLSRFWIDKYEVSVTAYQSCVDAGICPTTAAGLGCNLGRNDRGNHPINCVDWEQAAIYCDSEGKRLPTEAEWEKAARGTDGRRFPWGETAPNDTLLNYLPGGIESTTTVGNYVAGVSFYGIHDMGGNVSEWTSDVYHAGYYYESQTTDPQGPLPTPNSTRVGRGGNWNQRFEDALTATVRLNFVPTTVDPAVGFRCATDSLPGDL